MKKTWRQIAALLCAGILLSGCTFSDSLQTNEIRSVWGPSRPSLPPRTVFFATDREPDGAGGFSLHWGGALRCGRATVAISNALTAPKPDPILMPIACDGGAALEDFARQVVAAAKGCGRVLLIVHGYNQTFRSGLLHGAQLAIDARWPCAVVTFNWSSEAKFNRYAADLERSGYAVPHLIALVRALRGAGLGLDLLGHSMGARISLGALSALCAAPERIAGELILAAADVSDEPGNDDFGRLLARDASCVGRTTIYASDNDMALMASQSIHGGVPRAGREPQSDMQYAKDGAAVEVIDASLAPGDPAGHGYFLFSYEMVSDIMAVLAGVPIRERAAAGGLACADWNGTTCAKGGGYYSLVVAEDRHPDWSSRLARHLLPVILPVQ
jgi:esterase/lipase superfamily enzyme